MYLNRSVSISVFLFSWLTFYSQDTIHFRNQTVELAKILEVGLQEVTYRRWDNIGGPLFIKKKNDIYFIAYENGHRDTFQIRISAPVTEATNRPADFNFIEITPGGLYYKGYPLNERELLKLIRNYPASSKRFSMLSEFELMRTYKKRQIKAFIIGGLIAIYIPMMTTVISIEETDNPLPFIAGGVVTGAGIGLLSHYLYKQNKSKREHKKEEIVRIYNSP